MTLAGWAVIAVILFCIYFVATTQVAADIVFLGGLTVLFISGVMTPEEALVGFSNQGLLTVGALYIVAGGFKETGAVQLVVERIIGRSRTIRMAQMKIMAPVMAISAFLNNTPVVASFIPAIEDWARKNRIPASKLLIPLSYAAILGGTCTLIGTSTNLVVNGLLLEGGATDSLGIFEPGLVGVPIAVAGFIYLALVGREQLPIRLSGFDTFKDPREYTMEMTVGKGSSLTNKKLVETGLMQLPDLFIVEVNRDDQIITPINKDFVLQENDQIIFTGILESIIDLKKIKGLRPASEQLFKLDSSERERLLFEAVISQSNPMTGMNVRNGNFLGRYNGIVLAVSRNGERINKSVGDITLKSGDTLLIEAHVNFLEQYKNSSDFYLISSIGNSHSPNYKKTSTAWVIITVLVSTVVLGVFNVFQASFFAAGMMLLTGCLPFSSVNKSIDWTTLLVIAATLGISNGLEVTGTASYLAGEVMQLSQGSPYIALIVTYVVTTILTEFISNNASAIFIFPIAVAIAMALGVNFMPFVIVIIMAASASFISPISYQTNLMVYGPGGYHFTDFAKVGLPLNILVGVIAIILTPLIWPF